MLFAVLSLLVAAPTASAATQGPWNLPPVDLSNGQSDIADPQVDVGDDGTAAVTYESNSQAIASVLAPGGNLVPGVGIGVGGQQRVAVAPDGTVTVVYRGGGASAPLIQSVTKAPGGSFGNSESVAFSLAAIQVMPDVTSGPDGTLTAVWMQYEDDFFSGVDLMASTRAPGGVWSPAETVAEGIVGPGRARVSTGPDGTTAVVWASEKTEGQRDVHVALREPSDTEFGPAQSLGSSWSDSKSLQVSVGPQGRTTVIWTSASFDSDGVIRISVRPPSGNFGNPEILSPGDEFANSPHIAENSDGRSVVAWAENGPGVRDERIGATLGQPDGTFSERVLLSEAGQDASKPNVAISPDGTATVAWSRIVGSKPGAVVQASTAFPGEGFGAVTDISEPGIVRDLVLAAGSGGLAIAAWRMTYDIPQPPFFIEGPIYMQAATTSSVEPKLTIQSISPKRRQIRKRKALSLKLTAKNVGSASAKSVVLCVHVGKKVKKKYLKPVGKMCKPVGDLAVNSSKSRSFKARATSKVKKGQSFKVVFSLSGISTGVTKRTILVRGK